MKAIDIAIIVIVAALFAVALGFMIYRKLKGKGGCDCGDCSACCGCKRCAEQAAKKNKNNR